MELKKVMLAIGIGILAALFLGYLIEAIYPSPEYNDFCKSNNSPYFPKSIQTENSSCTFEENYTKINECNQNGGFIESTYDDNGCITSQSCNTCANSYQTASENYNKNLFYITAPIALLLIILGLYLPVSIDAIAAGALFAGILTMIQITIRVFSDLGKWPRVILLGLELIIVIWIGLKRVYHISLFKKKQTRKNKNKLKNN